MVRRTLLIVEDQEANRGILKRILADDYEILEASNGQKAIEVMNCEYERISAVLLDLAMPVMDGFEVLSRMSMSAVLRRLPVIVMTGNSNEASEVRALTLGAKDYLTKPYNSTIIKQRIKNTIDLRENAAMVNELQRDRLTGLYNRGTLFQKISELIAGKEPGYYTISCFDIDNFKFINDQLGTEAGDEVLRHIARCLDEWTQQNGGVCGRIMADNFAIVFPSELTNTESTAQTREKITTPPCLDHPITIRVGRYVISNTEMSPTMIYDRAALAATSVKGLYGKYIAVFDETMREKLLEEQYIVATMGDALRMGQFEVWFQPQYNHESGALIGSEALVRWRNPEKGMIYPSIFIPIFEKNGFVYELDKYVWEQVCKCLRKWIDEGRNPLPVSVNISRFDVFKDDLVDVICDLIHKYNLTESLLRLEITESAFSKSAEQIIFVVKRFIELGFTVEIDDFGSGYSSLNTLKDVPAQILKLDMRFLESGQNSERGGNILESIVRMAKWIGMTVIAEGVETVEQADFLKSIGVSYVQGYLYAKPMPILEYEALCRGMGKEEHLMTLETIENLDNNAFWDPKSMDTLIFNSYIGGACIFEYTGGNIELLRVNKKYVEMIGSGGMTTEDALRLDWMEHLDETNRIAIIGALEKSIRTSDEVTSEFVFFNMPGNPKKTYLRLTMRVIAAAGERYLVYCTNENITAQRVSEQKERMVSQEMKAILEGMNGGVSMTVIKDIDKPTFVYANDNYYRIFGYTREQMVAEQKSFETILYPEEKKAMRQSVKKILNDRQPRIIEHRCYRRDGSTCYVRCNVSVSSIEGLGENVMISVVTDVTEHMAMVEKLRVSEEENRIAIRQSGGMVFRYSIVDRTITVSPEIAAFFKIPEKVIGVPYDEARNKNISPESLNAYIGFYESILRGEKFGGAQFQCFTRDGRRWMDAYFSTIFSESGEPVSAVVSLRDITERIEKEAVFTKWQQSLLEKKPETYILFKSNISKNASLECMSGALMDIHFSAELLSFDERTAEYVNQYVNEEDRAELFGFLKSDTLLANYHRGKRRASLDYREIIPGGDRWLRLTVDLVEYPNSDDVCAHMLFEDIDREKREELLTLHKANSDPLTGVLNRAAFALQVERCLQSTQPNTRHALLMLGIDDFKKVNDVFGHAVGDRALIDLAGSLRSVIHKNDLIGRLGGDEFLILLRNVPNDATAAEKVKQICALTRRTFSPEVQITASVGIAMYPADGGDFDTLYKNVDAAFYHVKSAGKNNFAFFREGMNEEKLTPDENGGENKQKPKRRMLIVDDNEIDVALTAHIFKDDFRIVKARDGMSALMRLRHYGTAISVVLLDLNMPGMDGFEVLEKMQRYTDLSTVPVIVLSGSDDAQTSLRAIRSGATDYIIKPAESELLKTRVDAAISKAENERLRAQNSLLEYQNEEVRRYKTVLEQSGVIVIEYNWIKSTFSYDPVISEYIDGCFDNRPLWQILLSDMIADTLTVQRMQVLTHEMAQDEGRANAGITVTLKTPKNGKHTFRFNVFKQTTESNSTSKLILTLFDMDADSSD